MSSPLASKAFVVVVFCLHPPSLIFVDCVEGVDLACADGYGAGLEDGAAVGVDAGWVFFAGFDVVGGAGAAVGVAAVDEGFAGEGVEECVYPAAAGE
jgi:hypothetical protein